MAEVSSAGDNDAQHLVDNKCKSSDTACIKCEESENKLQGTLLEISSAKLIIKLLQKETDTITAPARTTRPNIGSGVYGENEVSNDNDWIQATFGHSYKLGYSKKYSTKYEKQPTGQHIGTFNHFVPLATQCSNNSAQPYWEVCTPKQTVNHVNQPNKRNNGPSNHSSMLHNLTNKQGSYNINRKLASGNRVNIVKTVPKNPKISGSVSRWNKKYSKKRTLHYNCRR